MNVIININTDNAAFAEMVGPELADALRGLADKVEGMEEAIEAHRLTVLDTFGNTVGTVLVSNDFWLQAND